MQEEDSMEDSIQDLIIEDGIYMEDQVGELIKEIMQDRMDGQMQKLIQK